MSVETQALGPGGTFTDSPDPTQLFARACEPETRPCLLADGVNYKRGCVIFAADQDAEFAQVAHGSIPAATDVVGVVAEDIDCSGASDSTKHVMYVGPASFVYQTLGNASKDDLTAADWKALIEVMISKGMNVVSAAYGVFTPHA